MPLAYLLSIARKIHIFIKIKIIFFFVFQSYPCVHVYMCTFFFEYWDSKKWEEKKYKYIIYFLFMDNILNYKFDKIQNL